MEAPIAFANSLADPTRWRIASLVAEEALCVCELADILRLPQSTLSTHLQVMRNAELVDVERCEKWAYYRLSRLARPLWSLMQRIFAGDLTSDSILKADRKDMASRLALRGVTECKGPRRAIPPGPPPRRNKKSNQPAHQTA
ncbi:MAG: ArsR/SmtB family transcription factor [Verrucomicrobiales bacterium]